jgi:curved DNA-binding protein
MANEYYDILGLKQSASADEIKRAFRKKAHEHHPDKGGDQEQFKKINEAYQTLSDDQKRRQYDALGGNPAGQGGFGGGGAGFDGFDFNFGGFGGQQGGFGDFFSDMFGAALANIQAEVQISVAQAVLGDTIELRVGDERVKLEIPAGTQDGQQMVYRGKGKPYRNGKGDLTIILRVLIPRRISKQERELYEKLRGLQ